MNWRATAWAVLAAFTLLLAWTSFSYRSKYLKCKEEMEVMAAQAQARQSVLEAQQKEEVKQYEAKASSDAAAIRSLHGSLDRLRRSAKAVRTDKAGAASEAGGGAGEKPDIVGAFLEGAELASEGAELVRREHTALETCVRMYSQAEASRK